MTTIHTIVLIVHVLVGASIILLVMIQRGKGAEAGAAFGAGASGTVFGARGSANFLSRTTAVMATAFFVTSLGLAYLARQERPVTSVLDSAIEVPLESVVPNVSPTPGSSALTDGLPALPVEPVLAPPAGTESQQP